MTRPDAPPMATIAFHRFLRLVWRWVVWLDAWLIDHALVVLVLAAAVTAVLAVERGIQEGMWGKTMITAWHNEEVAARNVEVIRDSIKEHNHEPVLQEWPWLTGQKLARVRRIRQEWRDVDAKLQRELAEENAVVPSSLGYARQGAFRRRSRLGAPRGRGTQARKSSSAHRAVHPARGRSLKRSNLAAVSGKTVSIPKQILTRRQPPHLEAQ